MPTKDELETRLYERMSQENKAFLTEIKVKTPDEIISRAYEIACHDNLLMLFEDETSLSESAKTASTLNRRRSLCIRLVLEPFSALLVYRKHIRPRMV